MTDYHCHLFPVSTMGLPTSRIHRHGLGSGGRRIQYRLLHSSPDQRGLRQHPGHREAATRELQDVLDRAAIPLVLVPGMEYYLDEFLLDALAEPLLLPGNVFLVEASPHCDPQFIIEILYQAISKGLTPLIAHPERSKVFTKEGNGRSTGLNGIRNLLWPFNSKLKAQNPELEEASLLRSLGAMGCKFQGNLGSFAGWYGERVRHTAERLREAGVYTHFGSDAHSAQHVRGLQLAAPAP